MLVWRIVKDGMVYPSVLILAMSHFVITKIAVIGTTQYVILIRML